MKKKDIERILKSEIEQNVPFVLPEVLKTPCEVEQVINEAKEERKPHFQFRYLYVTFAMFAILIVGLGTFLPYTRNNNFMSPNNNSVVCEYTVNTSIEMGDIKFDIVSNEKGIITNLKINNVNDPFAVRQDIKEVLIYLIDQLNSNDLINTNSATLTVKTSDAGYAEIQHNIIKGYLASAIELANLKINIE